jgi:DNA replication ATP-dependent helicase Dna2
MGYPGSGKTFTICMLLKILLAKGLRVLVTSYTHLSLDHVILKYLEYFPGDQNFLQRMCQTRSSNTTQTMTEITYDRKTLKNFTQIEEFLSQKRLIFTTCLSLRNSLLSSKKFDYVIVYEASQIIEPTIIESFFYSPKIILIGDYYQQSPIIHSKEARGKGMEIGLFQRLCEAFKGAVSYLDIQYRMNRDIMDLNNHLTYNNTLQTTDQSVLHQTLGIFPPKIKIRLFGAIRKFPQGKNQIYQGFSDNA